MKRYDLNLLMVLDALLMERSVSAAARRLGLGQPATSAALARLRALFDDPLLVRTPGGMEPTARALSIAGPLRETLADLQSLVDPADGFDPATSTRKFRISGGDYAGMTVLPPLVARMARVAPGIDLRFRYVEKDAITELLDKDGLDLALAVVDELPRRFVTEPVIEETFVCALRRGHPLLDQPLTPQSFAASTHVLVTERGDERGKVDEMLEGDGLSRRIAVTVPSAALVADILMRSDHVATIPRRAGEMIAQDGAITLIELPYETKSWVKSMVWAERNARDPGLLWLCEQIRQVVAEIGCAPTTRANLELKEHTDA